MNTVSGERNRRKAQNERKQKRSTAKKFHQFIIIDTGTSFYSMGNIKLVCLRVSTKSKKINSYHLKPIHSLGGSSSHCLRQNDFQWSLSDCRSKISDVMYYVGSCSCSCSFFFGCVVYVCGFQENEMT